MRIVNSSTLPIIIKIIIISLENEFISRKSKFAKPYIEELTVFIKVNIPNLKDSSIFKLNIERRDVITKREIIKISIERKNILISFCLIFVSIK